MTARVRDAAACSSKRVVHGRRRQLGRVAAVGSASTAPRSVGVEDRELGDRLAPGRRRRSRTQRREAAGDLLGVRGSYARGSYDELARSCVAAVRMHDELERERRGEVVAAATPPRVERRLEVVVRGKPIAARGRSKLARPSVVLPARRVRAGPPDLVDELREGRSRRRTASGSARTARTARARPRGRAGSARRRARQHELALPGESRDTSACQAGLEKSPASATRKRPAQRDRRGLRVGERECADVVRARPSRPGARRGAAGARRRRFPHHAGPPRRRPLVVEKLARATRRSRRTAAAPRRRRCRPREPRELASSISIEAPSRQAARRGQHERPFDDGQRRRAPRAAPARARGRVRPTPRGAARRAALASVLRRPGDGQLVVDHLLRDPHAGAPDEGRAQDLVPRDELVERRWSSASATASADEDDRLRRRDTRRRRQEQLLLLGRKREPRDVLSLVRMLDNVPSCSPPTSATERHPAPAALNVSSLQSNCELAGRLGQTAPTTLAHRRRAGTPRRGRR